MLDFRLLTSSHLSLLLVSFIATLVTIRSFFRNRFRVPNKNIYYSGLALALIVTLLAIFITENFGLKISLIVAALGVTAIGRADEMFALSPRAQLLWQILFAAILAFAGWNIPYVTNPWGEGVIFLGLLSIPAAIVWIILMMNAVNWLDGLDGLASSVSVVAFLTLAAVSLLPATQDHLTLSLALVGAGGALALFLYNAPPAKAYLGTTGSWFLGMFLALTAMIGGGKVVTALLVLAIPVLDAGLVIVARALKRQKLWVGDRQHLHYRLEALSWSPRQVTVAAVCLSAVLGSIAVLAQTQQKIWALIIVAIFLAGITVSLSYYTYVSKHSLRR